MSSILPVPHKSQLADGFCLPACAQMVLAYWGIERDQPELAHLLGTVKRAGTPGSRILTLAAIGPLHIIYRSGELADLRAAIDHGIPPIALVYTHTLPHWTISTAHAVVVTGFEGDAVVINDPGMPVSATRVPVDNFLLAWDEIANLYAAISVLPTS